MLAAPDGVCVEIFAGGSPAPKPITSIPSAFICFAFALMARVGEGLIIRALCDRVLICTSYFSAGPPAGVDCIAGQHEIVV